MLDAGHRWDVVVKSGEQVNRRLQGPLEEIDKELQSVKKQRKICAQNWSTTAPRRASARPAIYPITTRPLRQSIAVPTLRRQGRFRAAAFNWAREIRQTPRRRLFRLELDLG